MSNVGKKEPCMLAERLVVAVSPATVAAQASGLGAILDKAG
jgi:hypothetical protein